MSYLPEGRLMELRHSADAYGALAKYGLFRKFKLMNSHPNWLEWEQLAKLRYVLAPLEMAHMGLLLIDDTLSSSFAQHASRFAANSFDDSPHDESEIKYRQYIAFLEQNQVVSLLRNGR
ncbi:hypothetical protein H4R33_000127 [Dimargaris cristalligena]|nr:hypothetical protein H4R33_000127 [Dimargaris cristalligena]